ncbi:MAG TPA: polysaccharide deacetylase family protein [Terracidiphilus sp.]|nr:polysaccharide deacetylase family protein [Terracidiphilus sp.]
MSSGIAITAEARRYALDELLRRAEAPDDFRRTWKIEAGVDGLTLHVAESGRIDFPSFAADLNPELAARKAWPFDAPARLAEVVPNFVVPYARRDSRPNEPLFMQTSPGFFRCTEDLLASTVLVLSRHEELDPPYRDAHGRFEAASSLAARDGYLDRPIVDEYGLALESVFRAVVPGWKSPSRKLRVKLSHDIDEIGIPFSPRDVAVQLFSRRSVATGLRDLASGIAPIMPGSLRQVIEICRIAEEYGLRSALYWKSSDPSPYDSGYNVAGSRVAEVMAWARQRDIEMGVHPGYGTFLAPAELRREVDRCREAVCDERIGGRQHYLRWSPETWIHWEQCGLAYDSTLGYADRAGFRAGTCVPYRPWLWKENRRADLLEIPLVMMDRTLTSSTYMGLSPDQSVALLKTLMRRCEAVGGVLTLLWHNNCLGRPFSAYYPRLFAELAGTENYDWKQDPLAKVAGA